MLLFGSSWLVQVRNVKVQLGHAASLDAVCVMVCHTDRVLQCSVCPCQCCCCCCCQRWPPAGEPAHCRFPAVQPPTRDFRPWRDPANCLTTACRCCATGCMLVSCPLGTCCCARSGEGRRSVMKASNCRLPGPADGVACLQGCVVHAAVGCMQYCCWAVARPCTGVRQGCWAAGACHRRFVGVTRQSRTRMALKYCAGS